MAKQQQIPDIILPRVKASVDYVTIFGFISACALIIFAVASGASNASFLNAPALAIVVLGTLAVTAVSFTLGELKQSIGVFKGALVQQNYELEALARFLIELAVNAKSHGVLALAQYDDLFANNPYLRRSVQMAVDGAKERDIDFALSQELASLIERHKRAASMARRASETAPAMGLIGTLVGLVQMLADLENPDTIGPAMAVALLTTFYGAILGTVIMAPLVGKLEKRSQDETLSKTMIRLCVLSIARQDNPRKLEAALNAILPPSKRVLFFD